MSTNELNTSHAGYPTEHTPEARAVLAAALRHEKELAQEGATRSGMDLLDAIRAYRATLAPTPAPKPRYGLSYYELSVLVEDRKDAKMPRKICQCGNEEDAKLISAALNAQEQKP